MTKKSKTLLEMALEAPVLSDDRVVGALRGRRLSIQALSKKLRCPQKTLRTYLTGMQSRGVLISKYGSEWSVEKSPLPIDHGLKYTYHSRPDHTYLFGVVSDNHLGSKYERLDVLSDLYSRFAAAEVDRVFNAGNWIDGECRLNRHELHTFGLDNQCRYLAREYPKHDGLVTYALTADCHEGWFAKRVMTDPGTRMENVMAEEGREDWCNLGFLESYVPLKNASSGKTAQLMVMHPKGGSAYAISYKPQKIVESIQGGEKPAVLIVGHYHKVAVIPLRNVHVIMAGCTQDACTWTRGQQIEPVVGGLIVKLTQDPRTGAIYGCRSEYFVYYNVGYYNDRWNPYGPVTKPRRELMQ